jgi:hypothetical protein
MINLSTTGNGIDASKLTRNAFLKSGIVCGMLCKFVLKASYNRKLKHLNIFLSLEKKSAHLPVYMPLGQIWMLWKRGSSLVSTGSRTTTP